MGNGSNVKKGWSSGGGKIGAGNICVVDQDTSRSVTPITTRRETSS